MPETPNFGEEKKRGPPQFSIIMNIAKLLQHNPEQLVLHNPWLVIPIPVLRVVTVPESAPVLLVASHIRSIVDARRPAPVQQIIDQH